MTESSPPTTVGQLTADHTGWRIRVPDPDPQIGHRNFVLGGLRRHTYKGEEFVFLVDTSGAWGPFAGTERRFLASTPCELTAAPSRRRAVRGSRRDH